jgi:ribonucleoside-diphosphate reductase alpha chain
MQGGSRRSAIYGSLNWRHDDAYDWLNAKDWDSMPLVGTGMTVGDMKRLDYNFHAPLDMTNISLNYDDEFLSSFQVDGVIPDLFIKNIENALRTGEPGFSFNFGEKENETLRNACCEVTSEDDSDVCNLGAVNMANIDTIEEFRDVVHLASKFLVCGTLRADLPYEKVYEVREKNRRLGLGLMGVHEWLLKRGYRYEMVPELREWMEVYEEESERAANEHCDRLYLNRPKGYRAIAPTGTIGILAGTTTGIEPLYSVAYKRRYLVNGTDWKYQYVIDSTAEQLIEELGLDPENIESAVDLAKDPERRIAFQADIQDFVDQAISSTINLPAWGSEDNNEDHVQPFAQTLAKYSERLRGFTCYPDGSRGGQPITSVPYMEAKGQEGNVFSESHDVCEITGGGTCGS